MCSCQESCDRCSREVRRVRSDQAPQTNPRARVASFTSLHHGPSPRKRPRPGTPLCEIRDSCAPAMTVGGLPSSQGHNHRCRHTRHRYRHETNEYPIEYWDTADSSNDDWAVDPLPDEAAKDLQSDHGTLWISETPADHRELRGQYVRTSEGVYYPINQQAEQWAPQQMSRNNSNHPRGGGARTRLSKSTQGRSRGRGMDVGRYNSPRRGAPRGDYASAKRSPRGAQTNMFSALWEAQGQGAVWILVFILFVVVMLGAWYQGRHDAKSHQQIVFPW